MAKRSGERKKREGIEEGERETLTLKKGHRRGRETETLKEGHKSGRERQRHLQAARETERLRDKEIGQRLKER
jgi:hypothetical protein